MSNEKIIQMEIDQICKWAMVLQVDAYGLMLDRIIEKRKTDGLLSCLDIDNIVVEIMNEQSIF